MATSVFTLTNRLNYLQAQVNAIIAQTETLEDVLTAGDDANGLDITNLNNLDVLTINGSAYPPVVGSDTLSQVLVAGNSAGATDIDMNSNDILQVNNIDLTTINSLAYPPVVSADDLTAVLIAGNSAGASDIDMNTNDILSGGTVNAQTFSAVLGDNSVVVNPTSLTIADTNIPQTTTFSADTISSNGSNDFTIASTNSTLALSSSGNITSTCSGFSVNASDFITMTAVNDPIDILADDYINVKTTDGNLNLTAIDGSLSGLGKVYVNNTLVNTGDGELWVKDVLMEGVDNATTVIQTHSANQTSGTGYARLELNSGNIDGAVPSRAILQAFSDATQSPPYTANINKIDLGGANGEEVIISNGNLAESLPENTITMYIDSIPTSNFIELKVVDPIGGLTSSLLVGNTAYSLTISNQIVETIGSGSTDPITFRRNLAPTTFASGNPCGLLEKTAVNAVTSGTTTFTIANAFQTTINTPLAAGRIFVLPSPSAGAIGYWYSICNKSTVNTIAVQYPAATTIGPIAVSPSATNGGTVARFAVDFNGTSYSRIG